MVSLGIKLRLLSRHRLGVGVSFAVALGVAVLASSFKLSLLPPGLSSRHQMAGARTQMLVDTPKPGVLGTVYGSGDFTNLESGALLAASVAVTDPVRDQIAQRAGLPVDAIDFASPQEVAGAPVPERKPRSGRHYAVTVAARPMMPILDVVARAPDRATAVRLVNSTVGGLQSYLTNATTGFQMRLTQLGPGTVDRGSSSSKIGPPLLFLLVFVAGITLAIGRKSLRMPRVGQVAPTPEQGPQSWH